MNENEREIYQFMILRDTDPVHAVQVGKLSLLLFDQLNDLHGCGNNERLLLLSAAYLHDIGLKMKKIKHHVHSYKVIMNTDFTSFNIREKQIIANIARYHRKAFPLMKHNGFALLYSSDQQIVKK